MKLTKRIIALTISVLMLATLLPAGAFAIDVAASEEVASGTTVQSLKGFHAHMDFEGATTDTLTTYLDGKLAASELVDAGSGNFTAVTDGDNTYLQTVYTGSGLQFRNAEKLTGQPIKISFDFRVNENEKMVTSPVYFPIVRFSATTSVGGEGAPLSNPLMLEIPANRAEKPADAYENTYMGILGYSTVTGANSGSFVDGMKVYSNVWYSVELTYDPNTTLGQVHVKDAYGATCVFGVDCAYQSVINLVTFFRAQGDKYSPVCDFDNLAVSSVSAVDVVTDVADGFEMLEIGTKPTTISGLHGFDIALGSNTWEVTSVSDNGGKYLDKVASGAAFFVNDRTGAFSKKFEVSFDWLAKGSYNNGALFGLMDKDGTANVDEWRVMSYMSGPIVFGKCQDGSLVVIEESELPQSEAEKKWFHIDVVVDPTTTDYEIYVDGELRLLTKWDSSTGKHTIGTKAGGWSFSSLSQSTSASSGTYPFSDYLVENGIVGLKFFHSFKADIGIDNLRIRTFGAGESTYINGGALYDIDSVGDVCCKDAYLNGGADMKVMSDSPLELSLNSNGYNHFENDAITIEGTIKATAGEATEPLVIAALNRYSGQRSVISTPLLKVGTDGTVSAGLVSNLTTVTLGEDIPFKLTISGISMLATLEIGGNTYAGIPFADAMQTLTAGGPSYATGRTVVTNSSATINEYNYCVGMDSLDTITLMDGEGWTSSLTDLKVYVDKDADWYHVDFDTWGKVGTGNFKSVFGAIYSGESFNINEQMVLKPGGYALIQSKTGGALVFYDHLSSLVGKTFVIQSDFNFFYKTAPSGGTASTFTKGYFPIAEWGGVKLVYVDNAGNLYLRDDTNTALEVFDDATWETLAISLHPGALTAEGYLYRYDVFLKNDTEMKLLGGSTVTVPLTANEVRFARGTSELGDTVDTRRVTMGYDNIRIYGAAAPDGATLDLAEDNISLDLSKATVDFSYDLFGTAAIADGVLMTGEAGSFAWHDMVSLAKTNLDKSGFTVEMKIKAAAPSEGTRVLLQLAADDISRDLLTIDAEGKIVISGSKGKYPVASLDATEYTAIQLAFVRDTEMIGVYADGKLLGNVSYTTDLLLSELFALHFAEDVALSEFKVHSTLVRDYVDESGTIVEWDAEYYTDSGSNLSDGASAGNVATDGVMTPGNFTTKTSNGETFFRRNVKDTNQTELFVTGSFTGEVAQIDVTFRNTPPAEGATTASHIIRLRKTTDSDTYHLFLLSMEDSTGYIYLNNGSALYLCDEEGNRYSANTDWISVSIVYNAKMATARYAVNGELAYYVKASGDGFTEPLKANALAMNESFSVHQSEAVEMRIRYYPGGSANTVDISHIRAYKIADQNGISTAQTIGAQVGTVKLDASGNITANVEEVVKEVNAVRFLAGVDTTLYTGIGFDFEMWDDTAKAWKATKTVNSPVVYTSVSAAGETVTARELGYRYIVAAAIIGVDSTAYIRVRPYANLGAGAKMYGDADVYLVTYDNGSVSVSKPIEGYAVYSESFEERNMSNYLRYNYNGNPITADVLNNNIHGFTTGGDYDAAAIRVQQGNGYGGSSAMSILDAHRADNGRFSGRVKLMQILPDDLSAYEGATLRLSLKIMGSDFVTSQITEVDGGKEEVYTEATSATGKYGFMLADSSSGWGAKTYTLTKEGEWITVTTELTLTSTHLKTLQDGTTYDPICVFVEFGSSPYARDTFIDDVVVELITKDCELLK